MEEEVIPVLYVEDATRSLAWYERLGFGKAWEHHTLKLDTPGIKAGEDMIVAIGIMNLDYGNGLKQVAGIDNVSILTYDMTDAKGN